MIQTIEKQRDEFFNPREGSHSSTTKSSNENTPNIPVKFPPPGEKMSSSKKTSKNDINNLCKNIPYNKFFNDKSPNTNVAKNDISSSQNLNGLQNNKKDFIDKKMRRRNRCSYSNSRNKKSKKK